MFRPIHVLHVDDEPDFADLTATFLEREDDRFEVETATSASDGLDRLDDEVDCIISDYEMPRTNGIEFLQAVRERYPDLPFILFTGKGSEEIASDAISAGVTDYLQKQSGTDQYELLANRVTNAVQQARTQEQLNEQRQRFQTLFDRLTQATVEVQFEDGEPIVKRVNPAFEETFGYEAEEIVGNSLDDYIVPEHRENEATQLNQRVSAGERLEAEEITRLTADGERDFLLQNAVHDDESGVFAIYTDITDRKERNRELQRQNARLTALFENFPEPTLAYALEDDQSVVTRINAAFTDTFGYDPEEAIGRDIDDLVVPPAHQAEADRIDEQVRAGDRVDEILKRQTPDGLGDFRFRNIPMPDDDNIDGYAIYIDITEREQRERELERRNRQLEQFAKVVSHDLRSPLQIAQGHLDHAEETGDPESFEKARQAQDRIATIIEDVLTVAQTGQRITETTRASLDSVARDAWQTVDTGEMTLVVTGDHEIEADPDQLRQLFENLFRNSVDHSESDVTVTVGAIERMPTATRSIGDTFRGFYVADDGPGIPEENRDEVLEWGFSTAQDGTGFGLAIVTQIAEAHGWDVAVAESRDGGARFEITDVDTA